MPSGIVVEQRGDIYVHLVASSAVEGIAKVLKVRKDEMENLPRVHWEAQVTRHGLALTHISEPTSHAERPYAAPCRSNDTPQLDA